MGVFKFIPAIVAVFSIVSVAAYASADWPNEPVGLAVVSDWGFDALNGGGWHAEPDGGSTSIVSDPTAPFSPSNVYQQTFYAGMEAGVSPGNNWTVFNPSDEVYLGFYWKANVGFQQHGSNRTKIIFLSDAGGNPLFFYMGGPQGSSYIIGMQHQNSDICNDHLSGFPGVCGTWDIPSGETFSPGQWVKIELYVKKSTTTSSKDGILKYWVNGRLARSITNWNSGQALFSSVPIVPVWGGVGGVKMQNDYFRYDHIHISTRAGGAPIPVPAPAPAPAPQPAPVPPLPSIGSVSDLAVVSSASSSVSLSFTEVNDGTGSPAKYDLRYGLLGAQWGEMTSVSSGNCAIPIAGYAVGAKKNCTISGLMPSTQYQFQIIPFSGTMNQGAAYGSLSAVVTASTQVGTPSPQTGPASSDKIAPSVMFMYPSNGSTLSNSAMVLAQATDNVALAEVRFYLDGVQLGSEITGFPYLLLMDTRRITNGSHELSAVARDLAGNLSRAATVSIQISNSSTSTSNDPVILTGGCAQTRSSQVNASMGLVWLLPIFGLARRKRRKLK